MKLFVTLIAFALISGCVSGYQQFYTPNPYIDAKTTPDVVLLAEGQEPEVYSTNDYLNDVRNLKSQNYLVIGKSSFNGEYEDIKNAAKQAKNIGATLVLVSSEYTNTQEITTTSYVPDIQTTYHYGTVSGTTAYNSPYSGYLGSSNTSGNYSGTSTTYGTTAVTNTALQRRYNQSAIYFVKTTKKWQIGIYSLDLTEAQRTQYGTNTGAFIEVVVEGSPAYEAEVFAGDVLVEIDGNTVRNIRHMNKLLDDALAYKKLVNFTVLRQGSREIIEVLAN